MDWLDFVKTRPRVPHHPVEYFRSWGSLPLLFAFYPGGCRPLGSACSPSRSMHGPAQRYAGAQGYQLLICLPRLLPICSNNSHPLQLSHHFSNRLMDPVYGFFNRAGEVPSRSVHSETTYQQNEPTIGPVKPLPDSFFNDISTRLEAEVQKKEWTNRPRTWFILNQIKRLDAMEAFITQGLNDTSLPYKSRSSLPETLNIYEANEFLKWQNSVISDLLDLERGKHVHTVNGDVLFERSRRMLGVGSQG